MPKKKNIDDETVLEKALLVISDIGPDIFTLADIGSAVGLAPATLLQRFGTKQKLLILAARHANTKFKQDLERLKAKRLSWSDELIELLAGMPDDFGSRQDIANSLGLLKLDMVDPELHPIARRLFQQMRKRIKELLAQAQSQGQIASKKDIEAMAWEIEALRHGLVIQWTLSGRGSLRHWLLKGLRNYLTGGLK